MQNQSPTSGFLRAAQIIPKMIPVSRSTFFSWVAADKFPRPIKLSERVTVWRVAEVESWIEQQGQTQATGAVN